MKSKDILGKIVWKKSDIINEDTRSRFALKLLVVVFVIFTLCIVYMLGKIYFINPDVSENSQSNEIIDLAARFRDCKILKEDCLNSNDCNLFSLCGKGSYKICKIYDCASTYGVFTQDFEGNIDIERREKSDKVAVQAKKDAYGKSIEIVEQKCVDDKMQVMVKIASEGECKIGRFILLYEGTGAQTNKFTALKGNNYFITADVCGKITKIVPQTEEGIPIF